MAAKATTPFLYKGKFMKNFGTLILVLAALTATSSTAFANGPWNRFAQDGKFPTQAVLEHVNIHNPALGSGVAVLTSGAASSVAPTTFTSFLAQPDFPRNIVITPGASFGQNVVGVVNGTDIFGHAISENFTFTSGQAGATTGSKAFRTVTNIAMPLAASTGALVSVALGTKLGLHRCADDAGKYVFSEYGGVFEVTRGTMAINASNIESNTFVSNSALDGAHDVDVYFVENFRCYPSYR